MVDAMFKHGSHPSRHPAGHLHLLVLFPSTQLYSHLGRLFGSAADFQGSWASAIQITVPCVSTIVQKQNGKPVL